MRRRPGPSPSSYWGGGKTQKNSPVRPCSAAARFVMCSCSAWRSASDQPRQDRILSVRWIAHDGSSTPSGRDQEERHLQVDGLDLDTLEPELLQSLLIKQRGAEVAEEEQHRDHRVRYRGGPNLDGGAFEDQQGPAGIPELTRPGENPRRVVVRPIVEHRFKRDQIKARWQGIDQRAPLDEVDPGGLRLSADVFPSDVANHGKVEDRAAETGVLLADPQDELAAVP